jgi:hypothetical protein
MTTTFTPNRNYSLPGTGDDVNSWGPVINANFLAIDNNTAGELSLALAGGTITLTATQAQNVFFYLNGALTSNANIVFPGTKMWFMADNSTTGSYTVTLSAAGAGNSYVLTQGINGLFYSDGSNITLVANNSAPAAVIPSGTVLSGFYQASAPVGWVAQNINDCLIRSVNNSAGTSYGSWTISGLNDNVVSLSVAQMPSHTHTFTGEILQGNGGGAFQGNTSTGSQGEYTNGNSTNSTGSGAGHNHGITSDGSWRPLCINCLTCVKS